MLNGPEVIERLKRADGDHLRATFDRTLGLAHHTTLMEAALARDLSAATAALREHIGFSLAVYEALWPQDVADAKETA